MPWKVYISLFCYNSFFLVIKNKMINSKIQTSSLIVNFLYWEVDLSGSIAMSTNKGQWQTAPELAEKIQLRELFCLLTYPPNAWSPIRRMQYKSEWKNKNNYITKKIIFPVLPTENARAYFQYQKRNINGNIWTQYPGCCILACMCQAQPKWYFAQLIKHLFSS